MSRAYIVDRTLSMQEEEWGRQSFCGGHEIFQAHIDGHEIVFKIFDGPQNIFL